MGAAWRGVPLRCLRALHELGDAGTFGSAVAIAAATVVALGVFGGCGLDDFAGRALGLARRGPC